MNKTNSQASFTKKVSKKKNVIIILVILAIMVGHFLTQMSFIEGENKRIVESLAKTEPMIEPNIPAQPQIDEDKPQELQVERTDVLLSPKPLESSRNTQPVKIAQKESSRQSQTAPIQNPLKKEVKRDPKAERLRHAEKILTGF